MLPKIYSLITYKNKFHLIISLNILIFFLEFFTLISIPIFLIFIYDKNFFYQKTNFSFIQEYFVNIDSDQAIFIISSFVIISFLLKNIFLLCLNYFQGTFLKKTKIDLANRLFGSYLNSTFLFHLNNSPEKLTINILQNIQGVYVYIFQLITFIRESLAILVIFFLLSFSNLFLTFGSIAFLGLISFVYLRIIKKSIDSKVIQNQELGKNINKVINESFGSIKDIKILVKEKDVVNLFKKYVYLYENNNFFISFLDKLPRIFLEFFSIFGIVLFCLIFLHFNTSTSLIFATLSIFAVSVMRFIPAFNGVTLSIYYMKVHQPSVNAIYYEINNVDSEFANKQTDQNITNKDKKNILNSFLFVNNVSFSYPSKNFNSLNNITIDIKEGSVIGITGKTGSGKSTLFHLMLGLLRPKSGDIYFKGESIFSNLSKWRNEIGYISQNVYLLNGSIKKNISFNFFDESFDEEKLKQAISVSNLNNMISKLPEGIQTKVGNDGIMLSGGERQRIALARAIYKNPNIYFLDESTSALDEQTEEEIMNNIKKNFKNKTIILISHRTSSLEKCDKVLTLDNSMIY